MATDTWCRHGNVHQTETADVEFGKAGWSGVHRPQGIFIAYGKGICPGQSHPTVTHFDLVPTVLYLNDQPIPDDLDGHALLDWFEPKFIAAHPLQRNAATPFVPTAQPSLPEAEQALIEDRLRQLGYLE